MKRLRAKSTEVSGTGKSENGAQSFLVKSFATVRKLLPLSHQRTWSITAGSPSPRVGYKPSSSVLTSARDPGVSRRSKENHAQGFRVLIAEVSHVLMERNIRARLSGGEATSSSIFTHCVH